MIIKKFLFVLVTSPTGFFIYFIMLVNKFFASRRAALNISTAGAIFGAKFGSLISGVKINSSLLGQLPYNILDYVILKRRINSFNSTSILPVKSYSNADIQKQDILINNKGKSGIYRWVNQINGKSYIGSSINITRRMYEYFNSKHLLSKKMIIYKALLKYGYSAFSLEILEYCDEKDIILREQYYLNLLNPEYNILENAGNSFGFQHSEETKFKISEGLKGESHPFFGKTLKLEKKLVNL